ncbi:MAG: TetR/AcrR family transcriptional regulator [Pseudomonadota bacterium]
MAEESAAIAETPDAKEAAIIDAARQTFLANGFDGASMDKIALTAGVSKRTVYNRFRSKEALFAAALLDTCRHMLPLNVDEIEDSLPVKEFLCQMAGTFLRGILSPEAIALRRIAAFEAARTPALGRAYLENGPQTLVAIAKPIMERAIARGDFYTDDVEKALWRLGGLLMEPLFTEVLMGQDPEDVEAAIAKQVDDACEAFFKIYGPSA